MIIPPHLALIAERPASGRSGLAKLLRASGVSVLACGVSSQLASLARQHRPDVVVIDLDVAGIDGEQSVAMLEAMTTVILVCPRDIATARLAALEASGALLVLVKPVTREGLLHAFQQALAESRGRGVRRNAAA